jgi:hypothetical protein
MRAGGEREGNGGETGGEQEGSRRMWAGYAAYEERRLDESGGEPST